MPEAPCCQCERRDVPARGTLQRHGLRPLRDPWNLRNGDCGNIGARPGLRPTLKSEGLPEFQWQPGRVRQGSRLLCTGIIGTFARNHHIMNVAFAQSCSGNTHELGILVQLGNVG